MAFQRVRFEADPVAVRDALCRLEAGSVLAPLYEDSRSAILLALAEVMNNIAEHAYRGDCGEAVVSLRRRGDAIVALVTDKGRPAPAIPQDVILIDPVDLPEGGFGFQLIRMISRDIAQRRRRGCNIVRLSIDADIVI